MSLFLRHLATQPMQAVLVRQIYFSGVEAAFMCAIGGATLSAVLFHLLDAHLLLRSPQTLLHLIATTGARDVAPIVVSLVLVARSVSAIVTELASMRLNGEVRMLARHGISPMEYLVVPRMIGLVAGAALLFAWFGVGQILLGAFMAAPRQPLSALRGLAESLPLAPLGQGLLRSMILAAGAAACACGFGMTAEELHTAIPRTAARAVLFSFVLVFVLDGLVTYLF